jgi:protease-4
VRVRLIVLVAYNILRLLTWPLRAAFARLRRKPTRWVRLRLRGRVEELPPRAGRIARWLRKAGVDKRSVLVVRRLADRIGKDPQALGLLLQLEQLDGSHATLAALRAELSRVRAAGKRIVCYLPTGGDQKELFIASAADRILAMPHAGFTALGPLAARTYIAPLLQRIGIDMVVTAEGRYKTAAEPLTRDTMSAPEREQLEAIVRTLLDEWLAALSSRPPLADGGAARLLDTGVFGASQGKELGAIDDCAYEDELRRELALGAKEKVIDHDAYLKRTQPAPPLFVPLRPQPRIALVRLAGTIGSRAAGRGIELHATTALLRRLAKERQIAGVILHIDSPGGSALVSELLHREIEQLNAAKPVVTWMGGVAASGGYYLAAATRAIVAQPSTLTGSIGVVSLRPVARRLFAELRVHREVVGLTRHADIHSLARAPSDEEQAMLRRESARFYDRFLDVVASGRKRPRSAIAELAEGRVWSGRDAHRNGLVDTLGGYEEARAQLGRWLDLSGVAAEPSLLAPPVRAASAPFPDALLSRSPELAPLCELLSLAAGGERVFAYAWGLPSV